MAAARSSSRRDPPRHTPDLLLLLPTPGDKCHAQPLPDDPLLLLPPDDARGACSPGHLRRRAQARSTSRRGDGPLMVVLKESKKATKG
uniref:Uncharacterized protein n=1 Tax=Triticum urartu TaxID=4572 RepID=A0A8R7PQX3_TRIUA